MDGGHAMDARKIRLVQESFANLAAKGPKVAEIFYQELFAVDPTLRAMFAGSMDDQSKKLFAALTLIVRSLTSLEDVVPPLEKLAVKHLEYGVMPEHYTYVGNALLRTLRSGLGPQFTPELCEAWIDAFRALTRIMKNAAYGRASVGIGHEPL